MEMNADKKMSQGFKVYYKRCKRIKRVLIFIYVLILFCLVCFFYKAN